MGCKGSSRCLTPPGQADLCSRGTERNWLLQVGPEEQQLHHSIQILPVQEGGTLPSKTGRQGFPCRLGGAVKLGVSRTSPSTSSQHPPPHPATSARTAPATQDGIRAPKWSSHGWQRDELMQPHCVQAHTSATKIRGIPDKQYPLVVPHSADGAGGRLQAPCFPCLSLQTLPTGILETATSLCN